MATSSSQGASLSDSCSIEFYVPPGSTDPAWIYGYMKNKNEPNNIVCRLCKKVLKGGINRFKQHLAGVKGNVTSCPTITFEARNMMKENLDMIANKKEKKLQDQKELREGVNIHEGRGSQEDVSSQIQSKKPRTWGPIIQYTEIDPETSLLHSEKMAQSSIKDVFAKTERERVNQFVARWVYQAGISVNATTLKSFQVMCEAIGQYGTGYKSPTYYEISESLLKKEVEKTRGDLESHRNAWGKNGCSIMTDAWTDRKGRSIMNFCVNCELGTSFLRSIDSSKESHTAEYIYGLVEQCIIEVRVENVIQVVTDNAAANLAAGRILKIKYPKHFWSSCAAHCIDLMLEQIGKEEKMKSAIDSARSVTTFIYSHTKTLSMMCQSTQKREIVRPGKTRFSTSFLTLQSIMEKKENLRLMFSSDEWKKCKWSRTKSGEHAASIILNLQFWAQVTLAIKVFTPLVHVLRIVDGDRKPAMGFIYGELEEAKKEIMKCFKDVESAYKPFIDAVIAKSIGKLDTSLHVAGYYLNPYYYFRESGMIETNPIVMNGLFECIDHFYHDINIQDVAIRKELKAYKNANGLFGRPLARRQWSTNDDDYNPAHWWLMYGSETPYLQSMAIKILNLTCSSSGCERNWSTFEGIHTKKRNRLEVKKLNDLVYVQFNAKLRDLQKEHKRDPIISNDLGNVSDWLVRDNGEERDGFGKKKKASTSNTSTLEIIDDGMIDSDEDSDDEAKFIELDHDFDGGLLP